MTKRLRGLGLASLVVLTAFVAPRLTVISARAEVAADAQQALQPLKITTQTGEHAFSVEVANTEPQRERGLMYRRYMPADRGMLFDFKTDQPVMMWMKNTYIPLDMVFIGRDGHVTALAANTEPLSERIISSNGPAFAVLELNAGVIASIGLAVGDRINNPLFAQPH